MDDAALETLFLPLANGGAAVPASGRVLFLRARAGEGLTRFRAAHPSLPIDCEQSFRPLAQALEREGLRCADERRTGYAMVLVLPPRQRDEARATLAAAVARCAPGGLVVVSVTNNEGARSSAADLASLMGGIETSSKHRCRVFWSRADAERIDAARLADWRRLDEPRRIGDGRFVSRPGLFSWDRIDAGSALLAEHLPRDLAGHGADLGCGYGYLAAEVLARAPEVRALDLYEAEARALDLARINLQAGRAVPLGFLWHDVAAGLVGSYDFIVTNPPFHHGRADQPEIGRAFITAAAGALRPGGRLFLVANRHLPYEATLATHLRDVHKRDERDGYKVLEGIKGVS